MLCVNLVVYLGIEGFFSDLKISKQSEAGPYFKKLETLSKIDKWKCDFSFYAC
jgi:hypothetical protein